MIADALLMFSGSVSPLNVLTGQAANGATPILSANTVDFAPLTIGGNQPGEIGAGERLWVVFDVQTQPTGGTAMRYQVIQADDAALTSNVQVLSQTDDIPVASLPAGTLIPLSLNPSAVGAPKRYLGTRYVPTGTIATHAVVAVVVKDLQMVRNQYYKSGYTV